MEDKFISSLNPMVADILLILVKWELIDPHLLSNHLLRGKVERMLDQGRSMNYILNSLSEEIQLSKYNISKRLNEFKNPIDPRELELVQKLLKEYVE